MVWAFFVASVLKGVLGGVKGSIGLILRRALQLSCSIVGYAVSNPSPLRHAISSFHMPVFFILAGYTFRPKPWRELLCESAPRLLVPYLVLALAWQVPTFLMSGAPLTGGTLVAGLETIMFASGVDVLGLGVAAVGMVSGGAVYVTVAV